MPSLKEIRTRIATIQSTRQITSAMKMVAASRLRWVQTRIVSQRNYARLLKSVLREVVAHLPVDSHNAYVKSREGNRVLLVTIGSDRGLCGTYNALLIKRSLALFRELENEGQRVDFLPLGEKIAQFFKKKGLKIEENPVPGIMDRPDIEKATLFGEQLMEWFLRANYEKIFMIYHRFKNPVVQEISVDQFLPLPEEDWTASETGGEDPENEKLIMEPSPNEVLDYLTRRFILYNTYRILLDASASEHGSRMTAMHTATDNADELLKTLKLSYNKARQATVTREIMDIVGGSGQSL